MQKNNRKLAKNKNKNLKQQNKIRNTVLGKIMFYSIRIIRIFF